MPSLKHFQLQNHFLTICTWGSGMRTRNSYYAAALAICTFRSGMRPFTRHLPIQHYRYNGNMDHNFFDMFRLYWSFTPYFLKLPNSSSQNIFTIHLNIVCIIIVCFSKWSNINVKKKSYTAILHHNTTTISEILMHCTLFSRNYTSWCSPTMSTIFNTMKIMRTVLYHNNSPHIHTVLFNTMERNVIPAHKQSSM